MQIWLLFTIFQFMDDPQQTIFFGIKLFSHSQLIVDLKFLIIISMLQGFQVMLAYEVSAPKMTFLYMDICVLKGNRNIYSLYY